MAGIDAELAAIKKAVYGEEVRGAIHDALYKTYRLVGASAEATTPYYRELTDEQRATDYGNLISNVVTPGVYSAAVNDVWNDRPDNSSAPALFIVNQYTGSPTKGYVIQTFYGTAGDVRYRIVGLSTKEVWSGNSRADYDSHGWYSDSSIKSIFVTTEDREQLYNNLLSNVTAPGVYNAIGAMVWNDRPVAYQNTGLMIVYRYTDTFVLQQFITLSGKSYYREIDVRDKSIYTGNREAEYDVNGWHGDPELDCNNASWITGRKIAIVGDSISTFRGYLPDGYPTYYPNTIDLTKDVNSVYKTWWSQVIRMSGAKLTVNNSYSGGGVADINTRPSFYDRIVENTLGDPDTIFVALGTNDIANNVPLGSETVEECVAKDISELGDSYFIPAYVKGIKQLQASYPDAQIIILNGIGRLVPGNDYYNVIKQIAEHYGLIMFNCHGYHQASGVHPDAKGMYQIARTILSYNERYGTSGLTDTAKQAILNCFAHVAWTDANGQQYYDELVAALNP